MNKPLILLRDIAGKPLLDSKGNKQYNQPFDNFFITVGNRRQRRFPMQKQARNPFYGIHLNKYIQVVPVTVKTEEGIVEKLGRILSKSKRKYEFTGKIKIIDHYQFLKNVN